MKLSVVTTLYCSADFVQEFHRRATDAARQITDDYEIIMVDDGSPDASLEKAVAIARSDPRVKVVELSRNFGHFRAMMTGLRYSAGEFVFLIDVDLEESPEWLSTFWTTLADRGADVVYGRQITRKGRFVERVGGALHWWVIRRLSYYPIPENLVTARLMTRQYVRALVRHREQKTAMGGLWAMTGFRQIGLPIAKSSRGRTSYSLAKRTAAAFDGITAFSERPLVLVFVLGVVIFVLSSIGAVYLIVRRLTGVLLSGWASLIVSVWILGGLSIACIGVVGLYTARIFVETKRRPYAIIRAVHQYR
jgi:putative glycosyltransferase